MQDSELLALLRDTPEAGLAAIMKQYTGYVYTIAAIKLRGTGTAEDIEETVSDIFVTFYRWQQTHETAGTNLRALLAVIAKRQSINRFYALTRQPHTDSFEELLTEPHTDDQTPDEHILLMQAVQSLGIPDSEIILRRYYFGQSSKEIGAALDLKPNTVDQRLSRGLKKLREILSE